MADHLDASTPSPAEWRAAMGYFPTGVTIVTSWMGTKPVGSTINAFCSVSLAPPMLLICLDKLNPVLDPVRGSRVFGVNILGEEGDALARHFATLPETDRFKDYAYRSAGRGAPQLEVSPVFVDCALEDIHTAGDHYVLIGRGVRTDHRATMQPLLYHKGRFLRF